MTIDNPTEHVARAPTRLAFDFMPDCDKEPQIASFGGMSCPDLLQESTARAASRKQNLTGSGHYEPSILIHVGHPKTGSSALQTAFARSSDNLKLRGIHYPFEPEVKKAAKGQISSGNGARLLDSEVGKVIKLDAEEAHSAGLRTVLYSSELLFRKVRDDSRFLAHLEQASAAIGCRLVFILYVRNPLEHSVSAYHQRVKRHAESRPFSDFLADFRPLEKVRLFLDAVDSIEAKLLMDNFSVVRNCLHSSFERLVGIPAGSLVRTPDSIVNRSLTLGELELMRLLNERLSVEGSALSDTWVNELPGLSPGRPYGDLSVVRRFLKRQFPLATELNQRLPNGSSYSVGQSEQDMLEWVNLESIPQNFTFTHEQLEILVRFMVKRDS